MAKKLILAGSTDQTVDIFIQDSSSTTGAGLTGLVYNSASLVCYYRKGATGSATQLNLATQTVGGAHSDGGFVEIDPTNMPGMYRLDLSDTIVDTAGSATLMLKGATNMAPLTLELQLTGFNPSLALATPTNITAGTISLTSAALTDIEDAVWDADLSSHLTAGSTGFALNAASSAGDPWATALPGGYAPGEAGYIVGVGIDAAISSRMATYVQPTGFLAATFPAGTIASTTNITAGTITTVASVTAIAANGITNTSLSSGALADITSAIWDADLSLYQDPGSTGAALGAASAAGDPWQTLLPGGYTAGMAGYIVGNYLDTAVSGVPAATLAEFMGNVIPVNIKYVNDIEIKGVGTTLDPWNPV